MSLNPPTARPILRALSVEALTTMLAEAGFEPYRAKQLFHWVFARGEEDPRAMSNLPKALQAWLAEQCEPSGLALVRAEGPEGGTRKVLFRLRDGRHVESVIMRDEGAGRTSLCLSSQVGCAMGCTFCLTGFGGFQRNLTPDEIIGQAIEIRRRLLAEGEAIHHLVFMGMGEPIHNLDHVLATLRLFPDPVGFGLSRRRITVSTAGVVPGIERLGREKLDVGLAVSLNATTDETRTALMPINKKWPLAVLLEALRQYPLEPRRRITLEYVLLHGVNDTAEDARRLVRLLRGLRCKVNLIMFNPSPHLPFEPVAEPVLDLFARTLAQADLTVTVRWSKGREVEAACGQLAAHYFEATHA